MRVEALLQTREQQREHDAGDRDVERHRTAHRVEQDGALGWPDDHDEPEHRDRKQVGLDREEAEEVRGAERRHLAVQRRELKADRDDRGSSEQEPSHVEHPRHYREPTLRRGPPADASEWPRMVPEALPRMTKNGLVVDGEGRFVLNARESRWKSEGPLGRYCTFEGKRRFPQLGFNISVLEPGQAY